MPDNPMKNLMTTKELAEKIGVSRPRVSQIAASRKIEPAFKIGGAYFWDRADVKRFDRRPRGRPPTE